MILSHVSCNDPTGSFRPQIDIESARTALANLAPSLRFKYLKTERSYLF